MRGSIEAVIFDNDGTLVDSEPISCRVLIDLAAESGFTCELETAVARFRGRDLAVCMREIEEEIGQPLPADFVSTLRRRMYPALRRGVRANPGVAQALAELPHTKAVASGSPREKIAICLQAAQLAQHFEGRVYSSYEIGVWKPAPDLYLHAARELGVPAQCCAVVEDSEAGVRAGRAAQMTVFAYAACESERAGLQAAGGLVFSDMHDLPSLVAAVA